MERLTQEMETLRSAGLGGRSDNFQNEPDLNPEDDIDGNDPNGGGNNV
jgi:hypothetical protein